MKSFTAFKWNGYKNIPIPFEVSIQGQDYTLQWLQRAAIAAATTAAAVGVIYVGAPLVRRSGAAIHSYLTVPTAPPAQNTAVDLPGLNPIRKV
jgi:hypothetical protein